MFHVTRCPNCHTSFRVTEAHLAAFQGKVRCGRCAFVFDARENFVGETPPPKPATVVAEPAPAPAVTEIRHEPPAPMVPEPPAKPVPSSHHADDELYGLDTMASQLGAAAEAERDEADSLASRSLQQLASALGQVGEDTATAPPAHPDEQHGMLDLDLDIDGARGIEEEQAVPVSDGGGFRADTVEAEPAPTSSAIEFDIDTPPEHEPVVPITAYGDGDPITAHPTGEAEEDEAVAVEARDDAPIPTGTYRPIMTAEDERMLRVPAKPSPWRWLWSIPAFLALIVLAGQLTYRYRMELAIQLPGIKPRLERFCALTGCKMELPARVEFLRTEWSEIKPVPEHPSLLQVDAVLRNQATFDQALPLMELTLTDDTDRIVAKKVFEARTYLAPLADGSPAPLPASLPSNGEAHVFLQLDMGTLHSSGYSINWLYARPN